MSYDKEIIIDILSQIEDAVDNIMDWSIGITSGDSFRSSPEGMKTLAAICMLLEAIGEGVKKIDKRTQGSLLVAICPDIPWKNIMGMRDHIAHGYFDIDADFVYDVTVNDLVPLRDAINTVKRHLRPN